MVTVSVPPPSFFLSSLRESSRHWYISTLRSSLRASDRTPKRGSRSTATEAASPLKCTSLPSSAAAGPVPATDTTVDDPSFSAFARRTARPSPQNSRQTPMPARIRPTKMPRKEPPIRCRQLRLVVST